MSEEMGSVESTSTTGATTGQTTEAHAAETTNTTETSHTPTLGASKPTSLDALKAAAKKATETTDGSIANPLQKPDAAQALSPYTPNFKFKFLDADGKTRQEKEFDEWAKSAIKDAESEKKIRELYEKAHGLDYTKASRDKFRHEADQVKKELGETTEAINTLNHFVRKGDYQSFFEALRIPEDAVLKYALERVQYRQLPPERRAEYDNQRNVTQRAAILERQNQELAQQFQQTQVQHRHSELERTMSDPTISQAAQSFDARMGQPGAFQAEVIRRGQYHWFANQQDIPVDQAVREVMAMVGMSQTSQPQSMAQQPVLQQPIATPSEAPVGSHAPENRKPVIPNIQGRGTSPAKKIPRSIADLKKLASEAS